MDRLTIRIQDDGCGNQIVIHNGHRFGRALFPSEAAYGEYIELLERLAEYEDTGLTPERLVEIDRLYTEMCREVQRYRWIPVEERLPEAGQEVIVTCKSESGYYVTHDEYDWDYCAWVSDSDDIVAWMSLPESYRPLGWHG